MDRRDWRTVFVVGVTAVGLLTCIGGLRVAAGRLGLLVGVGIALVTLGAQQPTGFALSQGGVAAVLAPDTALPVLAAVEAGLVVTLLAPFGRVATTGHTLGITAISFVGFLAILQVFRSGFGLILAGLVTVVGLGVVVYLIHRVESVRLATVAEGER